MDDFGLIRKTSSARESSPVVEQNLRTSRHQSRGGGSSDSSIENIFQDEKTKNHLFRTWQN
jgi:hypothetical protein